MFFGLVFVGCEKEGCTDPGATNYNPAADKEDGSCEFPELPLITTATLSDIYNGQAKCGGNITSDGGSVVTQRGVCYSTSPSPTLNDSFTIDGTGTGSFISNLTGLMGGLYYVRSYATNAVGTAYGNELNFESLASGVFLCKGFHDDITSGGWTVQDVIGIHSWETGSAGGWDDVHYGVISNYDGGNTACESWLISPSLDLSETTDPTLNFDNAYNFSGAPLDLLVSVDYPGTGNPNDYTWTSLTLSAIWSGGSFDFVNSGDIDLSAFDTAINVHIAFKYTGTDDSGRTWLIDNIIIILG